MEEADVLDYVWKLSAYIIIAPIIINVVLSAILNIVEPWLTILAVICNFAVMFVLKKALREEYSEIFENPLFFFIGLFVVTVVLLCLCNAYLITIFTVIGTDASMIINFIGKDRIMDLIDAIRYR